MKVAVTGAAGFIGGHVVRELIQQGHRVTALCRTDSWAGPVAQQDVNIAKGDIRDPDSLKNFCRDQECIIHAAAVMGGYGTWDRFYKIGVQGTENIIEAATKAKVQRFIHLSSLTVYGTRPKSVLVSEALPYDDQPEGWNHYVRQKVLSEKLVWKAHNQGKIAATALRPSLVLGPGDRNVVARTLRFLKSPFRALIGDGNNWIACVLVEELARTVVRSVSLPLAVGKAYNLSGLNPITQLDYLNFHASAAGLPPVRRHMSVNLMKFGCATIERLYNLLGKQEEPFCTRIATELISTHSEVDCSLASRELDWVGAGNYEKAIRLSVEWYLRHEQVVDKSSR